MAMRGMRTNDVGPEVGFRRTVARNVQRCPVIGYDSIVIRNHPLELHTDLIMATAALPQTEMTAVELASRVGDVPLWRIRTDPPPGLATEEDVQRTRRESGALCELIDGVLVEKAVSYLSAFLALEIGRLLGNFAHSRKLGWIVGADGFVWVLGRHLRAPDVQFVRYGQFPDGRLPETGFPELAPALVVEVFSPSNTPGEMELKRRHFFTAGTELFWIVYPDRQEVEVYTDPETFRTVRRGEMLDGGDVLPGLSIDLAQLFDAVEMSDQEAGGDSDQ
jgi:Uma2 family endonuclease